MAGVTNMPFGHSSYRYSAQNGPVRSFVPEYNSGQQRRRQEDYPQAPWNDCYQRKPWHEHTSAGFADKPAPLPPRNPNRPSARPASSIYSQPSPVNDSFQIPQLPPPQHRVPYAEEPGWPDHLEQPDQQHLFCERQSMYRTTEALRNADGVSPESSPDIPSGPFDPPSVSPVQSTGPYTPPPPSTKGSVGAPEPAGSRTEMTRTPSTSARSQIPTMRRERRQNQELAARTLREAKSRERMQHHQQQQLSSQEQLPPGELPQESRSNSMASSTRGYKGGEVRWDPRTGELTNSEKGRPGQVKPIEYARGLAVSSRPPSEATTTATPAKSPTPGKASFASRLRRTMQGGDKGEKAAKSPLLSPVPAPTPSATATLTPVAPPKTPRPGPAAMFASASARLRNVSTPSPTPSPSATDPAAGAFISDRPAWHGASGRTTLVPPVRDNTDVAPLVSIPRKSSKRVSSMPRLRVSSAYASSPPPVSPPVGDETLALRSEHAAPPSPSHSPSSSYAVTAAAAAIPSPPLSQRASSPQAAPTPTPAPTASTPAQRPLSKIKRKPAPTVPPTSSPAASQRQASYDADDPFHYGSYPSEDNYSGDTAKPQQQQSLPSIHAPASPNSPDRDADRLLHPPPPPSEQPCDGAEAFDLADFRPPRTLRPQPSSDSVMERRRPTRMGHMSPRMLRETEPIVIHMGWGDEEPDAAAAPKTKKTADPDTASLAASLHKRLPPAPPETLAKDRVARLNAQLANLAQRRANIGRSIKQMTELMPTDNLLASADVLARREREKRNVEGLRQELAEIQREEYEIGLKLHRAYKRLDRDAEYEPTTLWVRRVTG